MPAFVYPPLPEGHIRLLRITPNPDEDAPIHCRLFDYPLHQGTRKGSHLYEALSYVWGSSERPRVVGTDGGTIPVTQNLHAALSRLRDGYIPRVVWIDAICINQDDLSERGQQVRLMATIYASANRVIVWLEDLSSSVGVNTVASAATHRALEAVGAAANRDPDETVSNTDHDISDDVLAVLNHQWFRRVWVLQEVAAARQVVIMCQLSEIDGSAFCVGLQALRPKSSDATRQNQIDSTIFLIKRASLRRKYQEPETSKSAIFSLNVRPLAELVSMYQDRDATDRRDKIFALLGMASDHVAPSLLPDYSISWPELFRRFVCSQVGEQAR